MIGKINYSSPSFGARIVLTPYFKEGLYTASKYRDDEVSLSKKTDFLNAVSLIQQDKSMDEFKIEGVPGSKIEPFKARECQIVVDGKVVKADDVFATVYDGPNCMNAVIRFANKKYGNVYANLMYAKAQNTAKEIEEKQKKLHDYINNELESKFNYDITQMLDDHQKVFNELPCEGLKYRDRYF